MKYLYLSYIVENSVPVYGGRRSVDIKNIKSFDKGDSTNIFSFEMGNHCGTHIDCPNHFFKEGLKVTDYFADTWFFNKPFVLNITLSENQIVSPEAIGEIPDKTDLLLVKSGFSSVRGMEKYINNNPGFSPETGLSLREKYPSIRAIGFDFISLSPYQDREVGRDAHRAFLSPEGKNNPILIIEDMNLSHDLSDLVSVVALPFRIASLDSAPCTVIGILR